MKRTVTKILGTTSLSLFALACSSAGTSDEAARLPDPSAQVALATVVYEHSYSATGRLTVYEADEGYLYFAVTGKAGVDSPDVAAGAMTLEETFLRLSPELALPAEIVELDARLRAQDPIAPQALSGESLAADGSLGEAHAVLADGTLVPVEQPGRDSELVPKSYEHFRDVVCQPHSGWLPSACHYFSNIAALFHPYNYNHSVAASQGFWDRVYGKNDTEYNAYVSICPREGLCLRGIQLSPGGYWGYGNWSVTPYSGNWRGMIRKLNTGLGGSLGLTRHIYDFQVK